MASSRPRSRSASPAAAAKVDAASSNGDGSQQQGPRYSEVLERWNESRWGAEGDQRKQEQIRQEEERRRQEEERVAAAKEEERQRAERAIAQRQNEIQQLHARAAAEREAKAKLQQQARLEAEQKDREIQELKAQLEAEQQASAAAEADARKVKNDLEQRARREAQVKNQAVLDKQRREELVKKIQTIEARGNAVFDPSENKIVVSGKLKFKDRYYGVARQDEPTAEFEYPAGARACLADVAEIWMVYQVRSEVVSVRKNIQGGRPNPKKDAWEEALALNRAQLIRSELVKLGVPQDLVAARAVFGAADSNYMGLRLEEPQGRARQ